MIEKLNRGLTIEIVFVSAFIGLAFRSFVVMAAAIVLTVLTGLDYVASAARDARGRPADQ